MLAEIIPEGGLIGFPESVKNCHSNFLMTFWITKLWFRTSLSPSYQSIAGMISLNPKSTKLERRFWSHSIKPITPELGRISLCLSAEHTQELEVFQGKVFSSSENDGILARITSALQEEKML